MMTRLIIARAAIRKVVGTSEYSKKPLYWTSQAQLLASCDGHELALKIEADEKTKAAAIAFKRQLAEELERAQRQLERLEDKLDNASRLATEDEHEEIERLEKFLEGSV